MDVTTPMVAVAEMAARLGAEPGGSLWSHAWTHAGRQWEVSVNRNVREDVDGIPAGHARVMCDGWPAAVFNPFGGVFAAHEDVNEDAFLAACDAEAR